MITTDSSSSGCYTRQAECVTVCVCVCVCVSECVSVCVCANTGYVV